VRAARIPYTIKPWHINAEKCHGAVEMTIVRGGHVLGRAPACAAYARYFLCDVHVKQVQLDELYAMLREVKAAGLNECET
jgi:hypothetical protein